ncbi:hypothetical protein [Microlunatus speluncae]|uniref:hypothetical protein n=1 Tax=Microlunatus speluncae TaxID=2594267 RepID=UPI00126612F8|nr:hypothetical protein [Microlunatus speluncae]
MGSGSVDRPWLRFALRSVEFAAVLLVGMVLLAMLVSAVRGALGLTYPAEARGAMASVEMGVIMALIMIGWLRFRRFGWPTTLAMAATMLLPALVAAALTGIGVIALGTAMIFEHIAMFVLMLAVMLRRRDEFTIRRPVLR